MRPMLALAALIFAAAPVSAQAPNIPNFWDLTERLPKPQLEGVERLRFLTTTDFPPFNHLDANGRLSGFNVDLARRICTELAILDKCEIQALPWDELEEALADGQGEAIIAGIAMSAQSRQSLTFSRPYLRFTARFATSRSQAVAGPLYRTLAGKRVGVVAGSAHERMLRDQFPDLKPVTYTRPDWMLEDLREGKTDAVFGDGMRLAFWLAGSDSKDCCRFAGGAYLSSDYLGQGLAIAVAPENAVLADAFNYAMRELQAKGSFAELYLRYFPISFY